MLELTTQQIRLKDIPYTVEQAAKEYNVDCYASAVLVRALYFSVEGTAGETRFPEAIRPIDLRGVGFSSFPILMEMLVREKLICKPEVEVCNIHDTETVLKLTETAKQILVRASELQQEFGGDERYSEFQRLF